MMSDVLRYSIDVFKCSQIFQLFSGCSQLLTDAQKTISDVFKLYSNVLRGIQMFTDVLRMFSVSFRDVLSMFSGCSCEVLSLMIKKYDPHVFDGHFKWKYYGL